MKNILTHVRVSPRSGSFFTLFLTLTVLFTAAVPSQHVMGLPVGEVEPKQVGQLKELRFGVEQYVKKCGEGEVKSDDKARLLYSEAYSRYKAWNLETANAIKLGEKWRASDNDFLLKAEDANHSLWKFLEYCDNKLGRKPAEVDSNLWLTDTGLDIWKWYRRVASDEERSQASGRFVRRTSWRTWEAISQGRGRESRED